MGKNGQKSVSQLANHRLQPLGHLSVLSSEAGLRRVLKQILMCCLKGFGLRFKRAH
jgi:hypothetical protein